MKMDDRKRKWSLIGGTVVICALLVVLITGQFRKDTVESVRESTTEATKEAVLLTNDSKEEVKESTTVKAGMEPETTEETTKGHIDETVQEIQPEVTKPEKPKEGVRHDPAKKPNGETVKPTEPVVTEPVTIPPVEEPAVTEPQPVEPPTEIPTEAPTQSPSSAPEEGQIYVPGFGWMDDTGAIGTQVDSDGDINKQVGIMD